MYYIIGFDPALINLGVGILEATSKHSTLVNVQFGQVDLTQINNRSYFVDSSNIGALVFDFLRGLEKYLLSTRCVIIEEQPENVEPIVMAVQHHLESCIRGQHPHIHIYLVPSYKMRDVYNTHDPVYIERKMKSLHVFNKRIQKQIERAFGENIFDAAEAVLYAIMMHVYFETLSHTSIDIRRPRKFKEKWIKSSLNIKEMIKN